MGYPRLQEHRLGLQRGPERAPRVGGHVEENGRRGRALQSRAVADLAIVEPGPPQLTRDLGAPEVAISYRRYQADLARQVHQIEVVRSIRPEARVRLQRHPERLGGAVSDVGV